MTTSPELENLAKVGQVKRETPIPAEVAGLRRSGEARLADAANPAPRMAGPDEGAHRA